jgi:hypothetical protein
MTDYFLPEDFKVYVSPYGHVVNWAAPGYEEKFFPTVNNIPPDRCFPLRERVGYRGRRGCDGAITPAHQ